MDIERHLSILLTKCFLFNWEGTQSELALLCH